MEDERDMKNTMHPSKPEDSETAIPQDREFLKQELERMLGRKLPDKIDEPSISTTPVAIVKCTCARKFFTSRRNKKKGTTEMRRTQLNGYTNQGCPVHFRH
jgi:hypothetical protein